MEIKKLESFLLKDTDKVEVSDKSIIDSLHQEIMDIGWKNDSLILKYEQGWEF